jgi:hypothetical protein
MMGITDTYFNLMDDPDYPTIEPISYSIKPVRNGLYLLYLGIFSCSEAWFKDGVWYFVDDESNPIKPATLQPDAYKQMVQTKEINESNINDRKKIFWQGLTKSHKLPKLTTHERYLKRKNEKN